METSGSSELISIITPVLNNARDIRSCLLSVAEQTYTHKEHWIIDGGSTDGTLEIIRKFAQKHKHIRWISEKDTGIYDAMNKGIDKAEGEWLYFLGSDDQLNGDNILEEVISDPGFEEADLLYGNILLKESGVILGEAMNTESLKWDCTHHQATFIRKSVFGKLGKYDTKYKICADWAFTIKCFYDKAIRTRYMDKIIAVYSTVGFSNTGFGGNPRLRDKHFDADFFSLFAHFPVWERIRLRMDDYLPKYLNPVRYVNFLKRKVRKLISLIRGKLPIHQ